MTRSADGVVFALWRAAALLRHPVLHWKHRRRMGYWPDVALPRRFSERMLWRKLFDRDPIFVTFADKLAAKAWIARHAPELPTPRTLWAGERAEDIPHALLRPGVIVKTNHGSGFALPIRAVPPAREEVVTAARRSLARQFGRHRGEWMYAQVPRRIFVEELVSDGDAELMDLRLFAGGGRVAEAPRARAAPRTRRRAAATLRPPGSRAPQRREQRGVRVAVHPQRRQADHRSPTQRAVARHALDLRRQPDRILDQRRDRQGQHRARALRQLDARRPAVEDAHHASSAGDRRRAFVWMRAMRPAFRRSTRSAMPPIALSLVMAMGVEPACSFAAAIASSARRPVSRSGAPAGSSQSSALGP
jgi:hypothetical protein